MEVQRRSVQIPAEKEPEGVLVRDLEHAVGADHQVHVEGVDVVAEHAFGLPPAQDLVQQAHRRLPEFTDRLDLPDEHPPVDVLDHHQPDKVAVAHMVVVGELRQLADGIHRFQGAHLDGPLRLADAAVRLLEHGEVQLFLAAEVVVDHPFGGAGPVGDFIHPRSGIALGRKHLGGYRQDFGAGTLRVALAQGRRFAGDNSTILHLSCPRAPAGGAGYQSSGRLGQSRPGPVP